VVGGFVFSRNLKKKRAMARGGSHRPGLGGGGGGELVVL